MRKPRIVIIGAGYAGITAVLRLQKKLSKEADIILINKHDYHYQTTWLHRNAVGALRREQTKFALDRLLNLKTVQFIKGTVQFIDVDQKKIHVSEDVIIYDYLVVALGSEMDTHQIPGLKEHACSIGTLGAATHLNKRLEHVFSHFNKSNQQTLSIVVGGGGFTGVELLGELTDRLPILAKQYQVDLAQIKVVAIEVEPTVLPEFDLELGEYAMQRLEERGVEFRLGTPFKSVASGWVKIENAGLIEEMPADIFIWTAGVRGNHLIEKSNLPTQVSGRVEVLNDLTAPGYPEVFVIGDVALVRDSAGGAHVPNAQLAMQKAKVAANNITALVTGGTEKQAFVFKHYGTIASLGKKDAIGVIFTNKKIFGKTAVYLKELANYFVLFQMGGLRLLFINLKNKHAGR